MPQLPSTSPDSQKIGLFQRARDILLDSISSGRWLAPLILLLAAIGAVTLAATGNFSSSSSAGLAANTVPSLNKELAKVERNETATVFSRTSPLLGPKLAGTPTDDEGEAARGLSKLHFRDRFLEVSEADFDCLARAIYFEARGEVLDGQIAVAQTVLNRVVAGRWPRTICGVTNQGIERGEKCQFSYACWESSKRELGGENWNRSRQVAQDVLAERLWLKDMEEATHYHRFDVYPIWRHKLKVIRQVGAHIFYVEPGVWKPRPSSPAAPAVAAIPPQPAPSAAEAASVDASEKVAASTAATGRSHSGAVSAIVTGSITPEPKRPVLTATRPRPSASRVVRPDRPVPPHRRRAPADKAPTWGTAAFGQ